MMDAQASGLVGSPSPIADVSPSAPASDPSTTDHRPEIGQWHRRTQSGGTHSEVYSENGESIFAVPTSVEGPGYDIRETSLSTGKFVVIMVGLPARGKTFIAQKLCRLLAWLGHKSKVYNVQHIWKEVRREANLPKLKAADFDVTADVERFDIYKTALDVIGRDIDAFFESGGHVAFLNDDFVAEAARDYIDAAMRPKCDNIIYIEILRDDAINAQFNLMKVTNPKEYQPSHGSHEDKVADFQRRVELLRCRYRSVVEPKSYIRIINGINGTKHEIHDVKGYLPSRMTSFLLNISQNKIQYPIYFARHGESEYNLDERLGGNPPLTEKGLQDAELIGDFVAELKRIEVEEKHPNPMQIWTSQLRRTIQTAAPAEQHVSEPPRRWRCLNEIHAGICENLTYAEVKKQYPLIYELRKRNKYAFRYPDGESYQDLVARLEPVIMELENANRVVFVVAHQAILRTLLSYFGHTSAESSVHVEVAHRTVWRCTYNSEGIATLDEVVLPLRSSPTSHMPGALTRHLQAGSDTASNTSVSAKFPLMHRPDEEDPIIDAQ